MMVGMGGLLAHKAYYSVYWQPEQFGPAPSRFWHFRQVFPYSVVPGGTLDAFEVVETMHGDPVARDHYRDVRAEALIPVRLDKQLLAHVSYRKGDKIYWTSRKLNIPKGELVLTDGKSILRARCGNRLASGVFGLEVEPTPDFRIEELLESSIPELASIPPGQNVASPRTRVLSSQSEVEDESEIAATPEPSAWVLYISGISLVVCNRWRRRKAALPLPGKPRKNEALRRPAADASRLGDL